MNTLSFTAKFLQSRPIPRNTNDNTFVRVSVVELEKGNTSDVEALSEISEKWNKKGRSYAHEIFQEFTNKYTDEDVVSEHYLALTTQKSNFEHLEPEKILGVSLLYETIGEGNELGWLSVDPENNTGNQGKQKYRHIGTTILNCLKEIYSPERIKVTAVNGTENFYKNNGFEQYSSGGFYWSNKPKSNVRQIGIA